MKLLRILSTHLGVLKRVPLLPQLLDALLLLGCAAFAPRRFRAVARVIDTLERWPGVALSNHRFGGTQFDHNGREVGHIHGNGVLDVRLDREARDAVVRAGEALPHHTFPDSGWVSLTVATDGDAERGIELLRLGLGRCSGRAGTGRGSLPHHRAAVR